MMHSYLPLFFDSLQPSDSKVHPFPEECMQAVRSALGPSNLVGVEKGQPLHLGLLSHLAKQMKDPDWRFPLDVAQGVDLGVTEPTWLSRAFGLPRRKCVGKTGLRSYLLNSQCMIITAQLTFTMRTLRRLSKRKGTSMVQEMAWS